MLTQEHATPPWVPRGSFSFSDGSPGKFTADWPPFGGGLPLVPPLPRLHCTLLMRRHLHPEAPVKVWKTWRLFPRLPGASSCRRKRCNPVLAARKAGNPRSHSTRATCPQARERRKQRHTVITLSVKYRKPKRLFLNYMHLKKDSIPD